MSVNTLQRIIGILLNAGYQGPIRLFAGDLVMFNKNSTTISDILLPVKNQCRLYCYKDNIYNIKKYDFISKDNIVITVDYPIKKECYDFITENRYKNIELIVTNRHEFEALTTMFSTVSNIKISINPFYNKQNIDFFKKYIYLSAENIIDGVSDMQYIHQNTVLNSNFFGKIIVMPNGDVLPNINSKPIGNIQENSMENIIYSEMTSKKSYWKKIRNNKICKDCLFQFLCPPLSNYEICLANRNLCNVKL